MPFVYWSKVLAAAALGYSTYLAFVPPTPIEHSTGAPGADSRKDRAFGKLAADSFLRPFLAACRIVLPAIFLYYAFIAGYPDLAYAVRPWTLLEVLATVAGIGGVVLRRAAYAELGKLFTFKLTVQKDHELVGTGPYTFLLHPSYTGMALTVVGYVLFHFSLPLWILAGGAAIGAGGLVVRILDEEEMLKAHFGSKWTAHASKRWRVIPFVW
ncbi:hypothetical protein HDU86_000674 [Geranomyces michiganensis]|nr:hypothetical protein HDU86_000674 [Geranomyces michiganensis]